MVGIAAFLSYGMQMYAFEKAGARYAFSIKIYYYNRKLNIFNRLTRVLRSETFGSLLRQPVSFFDEKGHSIGILTSRLATDTADVAMMVSRAWGEIAQFIVYVVVANKQMNN